MLGPNQNCPPTSVSSLRVQLPQPAAATMSVLAFKALGYGADKIPDKLFEAIPGGFFTPEHKRQSKPRSKTGRRRPPESHGKSEQRDDHADDSAYDDTDHEPNRRRQSRRHRTQSLGHTLSRSPSRGRRNQRPSDMFSSGSNMDRGRTASGPHFPHPTTSEYRPYNPQDYASPPPASTAHSDTHHRRPAPAAYDYSYQPQVNTAFRCRSATVPTHRPLPTPLHMRRAKLVGRPRTWTTPSLVDIAPPSPSFAMHRTGTPLGAIFSPSYDPPLAAILNRPSTNPPQPTSTTAARYTPAAGYTPSPANTTIFPSPVTGYASYIPADYAASNPGHYVLGNTYPSPPPFYRQQSHSQPSLAQYPNPDNQQPTAAFDPPPDRHGSTSSSRHRRHGGARHHRARSAGHHGRSHSRVTDKVRERLEGIDLHDRNLAASVGGALAGGLAGRAVGHGTLSTLIGAGIGAIGGRELEKRHDM